MFKLDLEKAEEPEIKLTTPVGSLAKQESSRKTSAATAKSLQSCPTLCDPIDAAHQAPPSMGFSRQEYYFCFIDYTKAFDCVDHNKLWKTLQEMGIPDHLTCLLRNLCADQEATVRTGHGTTDWFQIEKRVHQGCILLPCLFNCMQSTS